jgi:hypothetical protein
LDFIDNEVRTSKLIGFFCDFQYHANQFLPLSDEQIVTKVKEYLSQCIPEFERAEVVDQAVVRFSKAVTHFSPGKHGSFKGYFYVLCVTSEQSQWYLRCLGAPLL